MKFWFWLRNLPWFLIEVFYCDLFGHKVEPELVFEVRLGERVALCSRCAAHLRVDNHGEWAED